ALILPERTRLLSALVREEPVRCLTAQIGEQPVTLVPLPQTSVADLSFLVSIVVASDGFLVERLDETLLGRSLTLPVPRIVSPLQSARYGVPVLHTSWTVHVPEELEVEWLQDDRSGLPRTNMTYNTPLAA